MAQEATGALRQDTRAVTVTVFYPASGAPFIKGIWDKKTGGQVDSDENIYHAGAMVEPESLGGRRTMENITVSRLCRIQRDWEVIPQLMSFVGKAKVTIADQPLDFDGNAHGISPLVYTGTLKRVTPPDVDSEASGPAMIELEITIDGYPS